MFGMLIKKCLGLELQLSKERGSDGLCPLINVSVRSTHIRIVPCENEDFVQIGWYSGMKSTSNSRTLNDLIS